ncbi:hypothetical protein GCM10011496_00250 [Polaromonas eurypsychrophila]|uniref:Macro domain-containing protein n=1 Tax=Polaromonas eurypsychrophila TaxID=1614635 RepID=A0A916S6C8_9BURK|nr:hypothetical protein GCM10011496_00250 [Polaromonas eurypsychrophila]
MVRSDSDRLRHSRAVIINSADQSRRGLESEKKREAGDRAGGGVAGAATAAGGSRAVSVEGLLELL